jgi:hypothetical protein
MEPFMMALSRGFYEKEKALKYGLMELNMKVNGEITVLGEPESLHIEMVIAMMVNGFTTRQMALADIKERMDAHMKEDGEEICNMEKVNKHGKMEVIMKGNLKRD